MSELTRIFNYKLIIAISLFFAQLISANAKVNISIEQPEHQLTFLELKFECMYKNNTNYHVLTWRSGRYQTLNLANSHCEISAKDSYVNISGLSVTWAEKNSLEWLTSMTTEDIIVAMMVYV
jgi:hypothetical protein